MPIVTHPVRSPLYDTIADVLLAHEPDAIVLPCMVPGFTDAKSFTRLGAKWYGFSPVKLTKSLRFADLFHGNDERVDVESLVLSTQLWEALAHDLVG